MSDTVTARKRRYEIAAQLLDVQADGGDSPAAVVEWAMNEADRIAKAEYHERAAKGLREPQ